MHIGVKFLYEHVGTPQGFLTKKKAHPRELIALSSGVFEKSDRMTWFRMNRSVRKVLHEVTRTF